ncbi:MULTISPECIES: pleiotropic regulatory protein RsmS [unclassified Agarivorans]|uniref:pleiotropic regulatory protein RsmS n=1 Tax=unclassified Agarivorans TaxID=2636026 RepID=UPI0026E191A7|nr:MULTISPECIES: pleiotropic regulatory protein RsmS [unclassified Agarivorans]MDO6684861.1 pleiotropic regulatory protein RsmS [Agarivorans sp. 3_MG-2023]MDO6714978.1 pleiotropic regulatory protein RsmS [Agarivorans sp. 2_MG-2023]
MSLSSAPKHVQLAVDLIQLLEENQIEPEVVLKALEIIGNDYQHKLEKSKNTKE